MVQQGTTKFQEKYLASLLAQKVPFPSYPGLQRHKNPPTLSAQIAAVWQSWIPLKHSSISEIECILITNSSYTLKCVQLYTQQCMYLPLVSDYTHSQAHRGGGGEQGILPQGPQTFKGPHEAFIFMTFTIMGCSFMLFLYLSHCLDSMSERLGRISVMISRLV